MLSMRKSNILFDFRMQIFFFTLLLFCPQLLRAFPMTVHNLSSLAAINTQSKMQKKRSHEAFFCFFCEMKGKPFSYG